jgi:UDP-glucose 4-epimerase
MIGLTGATGFVGNAIYQELVRRNIKVRCFTRSKSVTENDKNFFFLEYYNSNTNWTKALSGVDCVIHCAGISGDLKGRKKDQSKLYNEINVEATHNLANESLKLGVKRFIYLSSVKVNGEESKNDKIFKISDDVSPQTAYSMSKFNAEKKIREISKNSNLEIVVIRSPAVHKNYGTGNIAKLANLIKKGFILPLKSIKNKRSFISISNLIDFIILCIDSPNAANETFFVSDDNDISTVQLIEILAKNLNKPARLISFPPRLIKLFGYLTGTTSIINQLVGSLQVDITYTKEKMRWQPKNLSM